jgi:GAF domain-containing protein
MRKDRNGGAARSGDDPVLQALRSNAGAVAERWVSESSRESFTRVVDDTSESRVRVRRLEEYVVSLLSHCCSGGAPETLSTLRTVLRSEHLRTLELRRMISDHHLLRRIMREVVWASLPEVDRATAESTVASIIDMGIEESVHLVEQFIETEKMLMRCSWAPVGDMRDGDQVHTVFCRNAAEYFDADMVALFRYNEDMDELVCISCFARGVSLSKDSRFRLESFPMAKMAFESLEAVCCSEGSAPWSRSKKVLGGIRFAHCMASPLHDGRHVLGLLLVGDSTRAQDYTVEEVGLADELARQAVRALESSDALELLSMRSRAQRALIEAAAEMQQEIDSEEIYRILATKLVELLPSNEVAFYTFDWERSVGNPVYATGPYAAEIMADRDFPMGVGIVGSVARSKKAEIIPDTEVDERASVIPDTPDTHTAMLAIPILGRKDVLGVLELLRYLPSTFTREELEIGTLFASHVAAALENAALLHDVMKARNEMALHMDLMTHDIANHVTPVVAYLDTLQKRLGDDPESARILERSVEQIEHITHLVDMVRTMARVREPAPRRYTKQEIGVALDRAVKSVNEKNPKSRLAVEVELPREKMAVLADDLLPDIFENLLAIAVRPEREGTAKVRVSAETTTRSYREHWLVHLYLPSRTVSNGVKAAIGGMAKPSKAELVGGFGIGLATARNIVDRYSGRLWVSDIVPGDPSKGAVFNVLLPKAR